MRANRSRPRERHVSSAAWTHERRRLIFRVRCGGHSRHLIRVLACLGVASQGGSCCGSRCAQLALGPRCTRVGVHSHRDLFRGLPCMWEGQQRLPRGFLKAIRANPSRRNQLLMATAQPADHLEPSGVASSCRRCLSIPPLIPLSRSLNRLLDAEARTPQDSIPAAPGRRPSSP